MEMLFKKGLNMFVTARIFRSKAARYVFSGGTAAFVNLGIVLILEKTGLFYLVVVTIAYIVSVVVSFTLQKFFTFNNREIANVRGQFAVYACLAAANLLANDLLVYIQVNVFHWEHLIVDQALARIAVAIYSFFIYRHFIFKNKNHVTI